VSRTTGEIIDCDDPSEETVAWRRPVDDPPGFAANMYDYLGLEPIFDELNEPGRAAKARLEALPAPSGRSTLLRFPSYDELDDDDPFGGLE